MLKKLRWRQVNYPTRKLVGLIITEAISRGADKVAFVEPPDDLPRIVTPSQKAERDDSVDRQLDELEGETERLLDKCPSIRIPIYERKPGLVVPLWFRVQQQWHRAEGPPFPLLPHLIEVLGDMFIWDSVVEAGSQRKQLRLVDSGGLVDVELWYEDNYTYALEIRSTRK